MVGSALKGLGALALILFVIVIIIDHGPALANFIGVFLQGLLNAVGAAADAVAKIMTNFGK